MITHNEVTVLWWLLVAASSGTAGHLIRGRGMKRRLDDEWEAGLGEGREQGWKAGYAVGVDDEARGLAYVYDEDGQEVMPYGPDRNAPGWPRQPETAPRPGDSGGRAVEGSALATMAEPITGPGRTIYPELAALAAESDPEPVPVLDPHWYARRMHELADWHVQSQEDAARFDEWLPGYIDWYRKGLEPYWSAASRMLEAI